MTAEFIAQAGGSPKLGKNMFSFVLCKTMLFSHPRLDQCAKCFNWTVTSYYLRFWYKNSHQLHNFHILTHYIWVSFFLIHPVYYIKTNRMTVNSWKVETTAHVIMIIIVFHMLFHDRTSITITRVRPSPKSYVRHQKTDEYIVNLYDKIHIYFTFDQ